MTDLNKERMELELSAGVLDRQIDNLKAEIADEYFDDDKLELLIEYSMKLGEVYAQRDALEKAKAQAVPEWISVEVKLPEIADASVLAHFQNGSIETVHIEDWFKDITSGLDEAENQMYTKWYLKASNTITHWMPLPEAPIETGA